MTKARSIMSLATTLLAAGAGCTAPEGGDAVVETQGKVVYGAAQTIARIRSAQLLIVNRRRRPRSHPV